MSTKKIIVGLGNIGKQYEQTRHNVGFWVLDQLISDMERRSGDRYNATLTKKLKSIIVTTPQAHIIYPQTYMNLSGEAVQAVMHWYKVTDPTDVLIIHDDVSLDTARLKWVIAGGAGGHHGIESIYTQTGKKNYIRLRVGIGPDPGGDRRADYVLGRIVGAEQDTLYSESERILAGIYDWLGGMSMEQLTSLYNRRV